MFVNIFNSNCLKQKISVLIGNRILTDKRVKNIFFDSALSFFYKLGSILIGLFFVPISLSFFDLESYGIWLTISSFLGWFSILDIGFGHGLRNKFNDALAVNDINLAKRYVATSYISVFVLCLISQLFFVVANHFIDWSVFFNVSSRFREELSFLMPVVFIFFSFQFLLKLVVSIYYADKNHSLQNKIIFLSQLFVLISMLGFKTIFKPSLFSFAFLNVFIPFLILFILNITSCCHIT